MPKNFDNAKKIFILLIGPKNPQSQKNDKIVNFIVTKQF
jgi:hypothetical protein